jgi:hypothetical protein
MSQEKGNKPDRGVLFKNLDKKSDKHADYNGSINVGGVDYWISAYVNTVEKGEKAGMKYMSLSVKEKDNQTSTSKPVESAPVTKVDDDLPF